MKLSIITINLNNREGLQRTIDSVIGQTFRDFEWIVIDGASTDGSKELIEKHSDYFAYWVSESDTGVYNAMNKGIRVAKGEYCLFLNSGDWLCNENVLQQIFSESHDADILFGYMMRDNQDGDTVNLAKPTLHWEDFIGNTLPHQASFIRRILFEKYGMYDESYKIAGDTKFFVKALVWENATYKFIPLKVAVFEGGGVSDNETRFFERDVRLRNEMFPKMILDDLPLINSIRKIRQHTYLKKGFTLLSLIAEHLEKKK